MFYYMFYTTIFIKLFKGVFIYFSINFVRDTVFKIGIKDWFEKFTFIPICCTIIFHN